MSFSVEQAFLGRDEIRAPLETPAWEVTKQASFLFAGVNTLFLYYT